MYNFDEIIDRRGSGCVKYDNLDVTFGKNGLLPLWVADMDFKTPDFIVEALERRMKHPIFGYPCLPEGYYPMISEWIEELHGWKVDSNHIRYIPGIVKGISMVLDCFFGTDAKVIIQPPVYHPFRIVPGKMGYQVVFNPLIPVYDEDGFLKTYEMDFEDLERKLSSDRSIRVMILSNPHNPCGIAWSADTLERLARIAAEYDILVISDEIHAEMMLGQERHVAFASVSEEAARHSISFLAPSKTFNIAGIVSSYTVVPDDGLREKFFSYLDTREISSPSIFSAIATQAAYTEGREWRREMLEYVAGNIDFVDKWLRSNIPSIRAVRPEASFLIWLDCRKLGLSQEELVGLFVDKAGLALNDGVMFGAEGKGFMRLNVGCPRSVLKEFLERLECACSSI